ncbi:MAG: hypothetical protein WBB67_04200 [bacterium]
MSFLIFSIFLPILFRYPKVFFIILIASKMMINGLYSVYVFGEINILMFIGALVPMFLIVYMFVKKIDVTLYPCHKLILLFLFEAIVAALVSSCGLMNMQSFEKILRLLNGITCFFAIPLMFSHKKDIRLLLYAWLISVIPPLIIGLYQILFGQFHLQVTPGVEGMLRLSAIYYDAASVVYPGLILILMLFFFSEKFDSRGKNILFYVLLAVAAFLIYRTYSRWGAFAVVSYFIVYSFYKKSKKLLIASLGLTIMIFFTAQSGIYKRFEHEAKVREKFGDRLMLTGRIGIWERNWIEYLNYSYLQKLIGYKTIGNVHNDFIRILLDYGFLGFMLYTSILVMILITLLKNLQENKDKTRRKLIFIGMLSHISFIIMSFGLTPSLFTDYQWFHWGIIGIALKKRTDLCSDEFIDRK